jgi:hypothetical protein
MDVYRLPYLAQQLSAMCGIKKLCFILGQICLTQDHLMQPGLLNNIFHNLAVHTVYNNSYHLYPFPCHLNRPQGSITLFSLV